MSNAVERVSDAKSALESVDEKISDTTKELEEAQSRIKDIQSLGKLSITDASDLRNLQLSNAQLLVQLSLLEKEKELKEAELNAGKNAVWNRFQNSQRDGYYTSQGDQEKLTQEEYVNYMRDQLPKNYERIAALNQLASQRDLTAAEKGELKLLQSGIEKAQTNLLEIAENLKDIDSEQSNAVIAMIAWLTSNSKTQLELFNTYAGSLYAQARELESINEDMDSLQSSYKTLVAAISEYNANGYMTVDTLQSFLSLSDDYIEALTLENGQLVLNTDSIIALANARLDEMLAKKWNQTVEVIDTLIKEKSSTEETTESIQDKTYAIEDMTDAALENYIVEQLGLKSNQEINSELRAAIDSFNIYKAMIDSTRKGLGRYTNTTFGAADATKSLTDAIKDQYDKLLDKEKARINAAKEVLEDRKKDLQDELDALEEQYEAEDKLLELQKAKDRYEAAKANKNTRLYTADKGWQWVSDPQELEDAKSSLDELHKEMERDEAKKAIQDQIDAIDDLIDKCDDALDILGQDWDDYIEHLNLVAEMQGLTMDQLGDQVEGFVDRAIDLIRQYSNALKEAAAAESMLGNGNGKKNTGGNDKPVEKDFWKDTKAGTIISDVIAKSKQQENWYRNNLPNSITNPFPNGVSGVSGTKIAGKIVDDIAKGKRAPLATGAKYVSSSGIYNVDDGNGPEIIARRGRYTRLEVGDGVVPADLTARLFALAKSPEEYIMPKVSGLFATLAANLIGRPGQVQQSAQQPIYIAKVEVTGVEDVDGFLDELTKIVNRKRKV